MNERRTECEATHKNPNTRTHKVIEDALAAAVSQIESETGVTVLRGVVEE